MWHGRIQPGPPPTHPTSHHWRLTAYCRFTACSRTSVLFISCATRTCLHCARDAWLACHGHASLATHGHPPPPPNANLDSIAGRTRLGCAKLGGLSKVAGRHTATQPGTSALPVLCKAMRSTPRPPPPPPASPQAGLSTAATAMARVRPAHARSLTQLRVCVQHRGSCTSHSLPPPPSPPWAHAHTPTHTHCRTSRRNQPWSHGSGACRHHPPLCRPDTAPQAAAVLLALRAFHTS